MKNQDICQDGVYIWFTKDEGCPPVNAGYVVQLPHETDCGKFYKCDWGKKIEFDCPPNQHWSVVNNWCDFPENAKCIDIVPILHEVIQCNTQIVNKTVYM